MVTEVMPAAPPHSKRRIGDSSASGKGSANWTKVKVNV